MKLYNTLTRRVESLQLLNPPHVTIYTCGPTVYDYAHIGHWFTYLRWDLVVRVLKASGYQPTWVMNITDVGHLVSDADDGEDKLDKRAKREGKTAWEIAEFYTQDFMDGLKALTITKPDVMPKATDHIKEQIALIQTLEEKGYTYTIDDGVYFDTSKFAGYGDFARLDLDDLQAGARVEINPQKRNPSDFALWKLSPKDHKRDMEWPSPWGTGFPGWHIECSAMAMKYLGETIDIHAGGIDHIPIHHTNEIAQSEAATGKRFCNYWLHANHVMVNGQKISKSLSNGIKYSEILKRGISLEAFRLHVFESHYRSQSKFSWESLQAAQNRLASYQAMADQSWQTSDDGEVVAATIHDTQQAMLEALQTDLDTPKALALLSQLETRISQVGVHTTAQDNFRQFLEWLDSSLGFQFSARHDITDEQKTLLAERLTARSTQQWETADKLRQQLAEQGITVKDSDNKSNWQRVSSL